MSGSTREEVPPVLLELQELAQGEGFWLTPIYARDQMTSPGESVQWTLRLRRRIPKEASLYAGDQKNAIDVEVLENGEIHVKREDGQERTLVVAEGWGADEARSWILGRPQGR